MKQTKISFVQSIVGAATVVGFVTVLGLFIVGWVMNIYKLIVHLPAADFETLLRVAGIPLAPVGALLGYFM